MNGMPDRLELTGADFTKAIQAVMRFPSVGSFDGAGLIHTVHSNGQLVVTRQGTALSVAKVPAKGTLALTAIDEKQLSGFSTICAEASRVLIEAAEDIKIRSRGRETVSPKAKGIEFEQPRLNKPTVIKGTAETAERISYLAALAIEDDSRPEISCVMLLGDGRAAAINQRVMAVFDLDKNLSKAPLPIPLAKVFADGDEFRIGPKLTVLESGVGQHYMPSPVKAMTDFPVDLVESYFKLPRQLVAECRGDDLARVVSECDAVIGNLAKTQMVLTITVKGGKLIITSENGVAKFKAIVGSLGKSTDGATVKIPADEMRALSGFISKEQQVKLYTDKKMGSSILSLNIGSVAFPAYK